MLIAGCDPHTKKRVQVRAKGPGGLTGDWLAAGFIDLQVNGFAGVDFNDPRVTSQDYRRAVQTLWSTGVTRFCPTIITGSRDGLCRCLAAAARAAEDKSAGPSIAGIHLEGPYISPEDGPRGAHPRQFVRPPDREEFRILQEAAGGRIRMVKIGRASCRERV